MIETIKDLIPFDIQEFTEVKSGGNSNVYKIKTKKGDFALKMYPSNDIRKRLEKETQAFEFLYKNNFFQVPKVVYKDNDNNIAVFDWFDGDRVLSPQNEDIIKLSDFFMSLQTVKNKAVNISNAADACFSSDMVINYFENRLKRFNDIKEISSFIKDIKKLADDKISSFDQKIILKKQNFVLSASDYGFHNAIKIDGEFKFIDFEYFGFDDPVKAVSDVLLHPAMNLSKTHQELYFKNTIEVLLKDDSNIIERFNVLFPIYGLIWCLIMLNIYLPHYEKIRDGKQEKAQQFKKARTLYERVKENDF